MTTPLFIPLRTEYFEAFRNGSKTVEYRKDGRGWNSNTCTVGRPVTLSKGYGTQHRLGGLIVRTWTTYWPKTQEIPGWRACYGESKATARCIEISLA